MTIALLFGIYAYAYCISRVYNNRSPDPAPSSSTFMYCIVIVIPYRYMREGTR